MRETRTELQERLGKMKKSKQDKQQKLVTEEVTLAGNQLVDYVKNVVKAGNVRRLIIHKPSGEVLMEVPLTAGLAVGGALTAMAPILAAIGAMAALLAKVKVEIVRVDEPGD